MARKARAKLATLDRVRVLKSLCTHVVRRVNFNRLWVLTGLHVMKGVSRRAGIVGAFHGMLWAAPTLGPQLHIIGYK